jgi:hypothetical protein
VVEPDRPRTAGRVSMEVPADTLVSDSDDGEAASAPLVAAAAAPAGPGRGMPRGPQRGRVLQFCFRAPWGGASAFYMGLTGLEACPSVSMPW